MPNSTLSLEQALVLLKPQAGFRFVDNFLALSAETCIGSYTFRPNEVFYPGHFAKKPITPGVLLLEMMTQTASGLWYYHKAATSGLASCAACCPLLVEGELECTGMVLPGDLVTATVMFGSWQDERLQAKVELQSHAKVVATSVVLLAHKDGVLGV